MIKQLLLTILTGILVSSCTPEAEKAGMTIDEVEFLDPSTIGGGDAPGGITVTSEMITAAGATELMVQKAAAYREASGAVNHRNGIYVYSGATFDAYASNPEKLAARIAMLGFKDVYLSPGTSRINSAADELKRFISACTGYGIKVYAVALGSLDNLVSESATRSEVNAVTAYNGKVQMSQRFAGISADLEPHTCHDSNKPSNIQYEWDSSTNYGKGKDNDQLLHLTLNSLSTAGTMLHTAGLKLGEAIFYNYQIYFNQGQLDYGSTAQFLQSCDYLVTMAYLTTKDQIWEKSKPGIVAAGKKESVSVCVKTRINNDSGSSIQNLGWNNLLDVARYVNTQAASYTSYRGFDMFTFDGIETMWQWTNDKN